MLLDYLQKLCTELSIDMPKLSKTQIFPVHIGQQRLEMRDLNPGLALHGAICELPLKKKEDLFIYLMRANLLGQGTGGSRIGLDPNEKFLTLSLELPYELNYQIFRETIEDFVNYLIYWREEVIKFEKEEHIY